MEVADLENNMLIDGAVFLLQCVAREEIVGHNDGRLVVDLDGKHVGSWKIVGSDEEAKKGFSYLLDDRAKDRRLHLWPEIAKNKYERAWNPTTTRTSPCFANAWAVIIGGWLVSSLSPADLHPPY